MSDQAKKAKKMKSLKKTEGPTHQEQLSELVNGIYGAEEQLPVIDHEDESEPWEDDFRYVPLEYAMKMKDSTGIKKGTKLGKYKKRKSDKSKKSEELVKSEEALVSSTDTAQKGNKDLSLEAQVKRPQGPITYFINHIIVEHVRKCRKDLDWYQRNYAPITEEDIVLLKQHKLNDFDQLVHIASVVGLSADEVLQETFDTSRLFTKVYQALRVLDLSVEATINMALEALKEYPTRD